MNRFHTRYKNNKLADALDSPYSPHKALAFCFLRHIGFSERELAPYLTRLKIELTRRCSTAYKYSKIPALFKVQQQETTKKIIIRIHRILIQLGIWVSLEEQVIVMANIVTIISKKKALYFKEEGLVFINGSSAY